MNEAWELLKKTCSDRVVELKKEIDNTEVSLEMVEATTAVYRRRGRKAGWEYGAGESPQLLADQLVYLRKKLALWEEALKLVEAGPTARTDEVTVVIFTDDPRKESRWDALSRSLKLRG